MEKNKQNTFGRVLKYFVVYIITTITCTAIHLSDRYFLGPEEYMYWFAILSIFTVPLFIIVFFLNRK
jgi:hypothetical protein